ncbi:hypothetical protein [Rhodococcus chondri]|uniref:Uncharacterized protein n=1 Tax=Rhodococcus chondri TaxID=3065941 RepID=A0ABU7JPQ4_9NOCA|nr:hypothetical protein [Rhodococcus sp. CC-R104]MEE2032012.1 hypothetical protein [Rhodococcus sp. CC-R104]
MYASGEAHFSWTSRRVPLPHERFAPASDPTDHPGHGAHSGMTLDRELPPDVVHGRLLAYHDDEDERDYVALLVGEVADCEDVPVHPVDEERLLILGARSTETGEIFVSADGGEIGQRELDRQLLHGGPLRKLLAHTGARSVLIDCYASAA